MLLDFCTIPGCVLDQRCFVGISFHRLGRLDCGKWPLSFRHVGVSCSVLSRFGLVIVLQQDLVQASKTRPNSAEDVAAATWAEPRTFGFVLFAFCITLRTK